MANETQIERYKKLISFIDENFKEEINIEKIEEACHYSYRNINRIFQAIHHETIGKYIKRLRLEKAAQFLKYSTIPVANIAYEVGFEDRAAFSKAFKKKYKHSPSAYRENSELSFIKEQSSFLNTEREKLQYTIEFLPDFEYLFLEYQGDYLDFPKVDEAWNALTEFASSKNLITENSIPMTEIIDDEAISDQINSRYNCAFILEKPLDFEPEGLFRTKRHRRQKYVKFIYNGSHEGSIEFYNNIYMYWMLDIGLELEDAPTLEFYLDTHEPQSNTMHTEIYIPVG